MTEATGTEAQGAGSAAAADGEQQKEHTLTQAEVDRIVKDRVARVEAKYADYSELQAKAAGAKTLEERLADLESELNTTKASALRTRIASEFGVSTKPGDKGEPSDADLFLTGTDEATLTAQAQRLAAREADRKKQGNVAPKEGATTSHGDEKAPLREFARELFGSVE
jgi:hypothetical protein